MYSEIVSPNYTMKYSNREDFVAVLTKHSGFLFLSVVFLSCAVPLAAQGPIPLRLPVSAPVEQDEQESAEEPAEPTADTKTPSPSPFVAAGWCTVKESGEDSAAADPIDGDEGTQSTNDSASASYCDMGIGFALYTRGQLSVVGVIGSMSAGLGLGWRIPTPERGPILAVAIGVLVRYDADGIGRDIRPGLGITLTFGRSGTGGN